jgi:hypothetical protein
MADAISDVVKHGTILALGHLYKEERLLTSAAIRYWLGPVDIVRILGLRWINRVASPQARNDHTRNLLEP